MKSLKQIQFELINGIECTESHARQEAATSLLAHEERIKARKMKTAIFVLTTGHSGTHYLYELLKANLNKSICYHERQQFGTHIPEISQMQEFNDYGNTQNIQDFWTKKFMLIEQELKDKEVYVETSHILSKCGLVENTWNSDLNVKFIILNRNPRDILRSFHLRGDFINYAGIWTWWLSPNYLRNLVDYPTLFGKKFDLHKVRVWYLFEMAERIKSYKKLLGSKVISFEIKELNEEKNIRKLLNFIGQDPKEIKIPKKTNVTTENYCDYTKEDIKKYKEYLGVKK